MRQFFALLALSVSLAFVCAAPVPSNVDAERKALTSADDKTRRLATLQLGWRGRDAATAAPDLARLLRDSDELTALDASNALVRIGPAAAEPVGRLLSDNRSLVRYRARSTLQRMGTDAKGAVPALADRVLHATVVQFRINCALVLARIGPGAKAALPTLIKVASEDRSAERPQSDRPGSVCEAAILSALRIDPTARKQIADAVLPNLTAMISSGDDAKGRLQRSAAMQALAMLGPDAASALPTVQRANSKNPAEVPSYLKTCVALGKDGEKYIVSLLADPTESLAYRIALLCALGKRSGLRAESIEALTRLLADPDDVVRGHAAWALAAQGPAAESAIPELAKRLGDSAFDLVPEVKRLTFFTAEALARIGPKALPVLRDALKDKERRDRALIALARMGPPARPAVPAIRELLRDPSSLTSVRAAIALLEIGEPPKEPMRRLVAALGADDPEEAAEYLADGSIGESSPHIGYGEPNPAIPADAVPALLKLVDDDSYQWFAVKTLARMSHAADVIIPALSKRLRAARGHDFLGMIKIYSRFGPAAKAGVPDILWCLENDSHGNCSSCTHVAIQALGAIGPDAKDAVPRLTGIAANYTHHASRPAIFALGEIGVGSPEVLEVLVAILRDSTDGQPGLRERQVYAACALMKLGPAAKPVLPALREALFSDDARVRLYAAVALIRAGDEGASLDRFLDSWKDGYDAENPDPVLPEWLESVELLGPRAAKATPRLIALLEGPSLRYDSDYRASAASALAKIGPDAKAALPRLRQLAALPGPASGPATLAIQAITRDAKP
jgi:HEAT repeat protein